MNQKNTSEFVEMILESNPSKSTSTCRICQLTVDETGEEVISMQCRCRGSLQRAHQSCLNQWVNYKSNNLCEICGAPFSGGPSTPTRAIIHHLRLNHSQVNPLMMSQRKRMVFASLISFLIAITGIFSMLTITAGKQVEVRQATWMSPKEYKEESFLFSLCLGFMIVCGLLAVLSSGLWAMLEINHMYFRRH